MTCHIIAVFRNRKPNIDIRVCDSADKIEIKNHFLKIWRKIYWFREIFLKKCKICNFVDKVEI